MKQFDFNKSSDGLIPAVAQDSITGEILMVAFINEEALAVTRSTGFATFYSRSKGRLWTKGEESGNRLEIVEILGDCDMDAVLLRVKPRGPSCHTGTKSCFGEKGVGGFLQTLDEIVASRQSAPSATSYTSRLLTEGVRRVAQKVGEEGVETALAGAGGDEPELINEAADLLFHLLVLLRARAVPLRAVLEKLEERHSAGK